MLMERQERDNFSLRENPIPGGEHGESVGTGHAEQVGRAGPAQGFDDASRRGVE